MINLSEARTHGFSKDACYIVSAICYYGQATIDIDSKKIYEEALKLERELFIRLVFRYEKSVIFGEGARYLEIPFLCCEKHRKIKAGIF